MTRVPGHGLLHEGRAVLDENCCGLAGRTHGERNHYDQHGHGMCSCGALSGHEITTAARQRWHREHKAAITSESLRSSAESCAQADKGEEPT